MRPYLVARRHPVSTSAGVATIILERLFDLLTVLVLFALYLFVLPVPEAQTSGSLMDVVKVGGAIAGAASIVILLLLVAFHARAEQAMAFFERVLRVFPQRLATLAAGILRAFGCGLAVLKAPLPHLLAIVAQSFLVWLSIAFSVWISLRAFDVLLPFHAAFLIIAFLTVGVAIPTPGNVGGFHAFFVTALVGVYGASTEVAQAAALACHALTNLPVLVLGLVFLGREGLSLGRVAEMTEENQAGPGPPRRLADEVSLLRPPRGQGGGLPREQGGRGHTAQARVPLLRQALHLLRAHRPDPAPGGEEGRPPRALRPREGALRPAQGLPEAAGAREDPRGRSWTGSRP